MNMQQIQNSYKNVQHTIGKYWLWLSLGILLFVAALAVNDAYGTAVTMPVTGSSAQAQTVPDAAAQGVADYLRAHSSPSAQAVPDAAVQGVTGYLQAHSVSPLITDPAAKSVIDYLRAHGYGVMPQQYVQKSSYRSPLDECFDVSLREVASCRKASQASTP